VFQTDIQKFIEEAFRSNAEIRYIGLVDNKFHVLQSQMREGIQSVTPDHQDRSFIQIMPPIIVDAVEKLQSFYGKLDNVSIRYEKLMLVFFRLEDLVVVLSFDPSLSSPFIDSLSSSVRELASRYLQG